jgi:hypothetical protein
VVGIFFPCLPRLSDISVFKFPANFDHSANNGRSRPSRLETLAGRDNYQEQEHHKESEEKDLPLQGISNPSPEVLPALVIGEAPSYIPEVSFDDAHEMFQASASSRFGDQSLVKENPQVLPDQGHEEILPPLTGDTLSTNTQCPETSTTEINIAETQAGPQISFAQVPSLWSSLHADNGPFAEDADWFNRNTSWDFPLASESLMLESRLLTSHGLMSDIDLLGTDLTSVEPSGNQSQDKRDFSDLASAQINDSLVEGYLGILPYQNASPTLNPSLDTLGEGQAGDIMSNVEQSASALHTRTMFPFLDGISNSHGDQASSDQGRDEYRETLFLTINRLLEMASAA